VPNHIRRGQAIVWDAEAATWPLGEYEIDLLGYEVETQFLVARGWKQPDLEHRDPNLVIVAEGPG
jgi:hypothetical protein